MAEPIEMSIGGGGEEPCFKCGAGSSHDDNGQFWEKSHICGGPCLPLVDILNAVCKEQQGYFTVPEYRGKLVDYFHGEFL